MAEQSSRDVVDQTLSGGEPSPSDVPASTNDKPSAGGDVGKTEHIAMNTTSNDETPNGHGTTNTFDSQGEGTSSDKDTGSRTTVRVDPGCAHRHWLILRGNRALDLLRPGCLSSTDWPRLQMAEATTQRHKAVQNRMRVERIAGITRAMALLKSQARSSQSPLRSRNSQCPRFQVLLHPRRRRRKVLSPCR